MLGLGWAERCGYRTSKGSKAAGRTGQGAGGCGHMTNEIQLIHLITMYKTDRRGPKIVL